MLYTCVKINTKQQKNRSKNGFDIVSKDDHSPRGDAQEEDSPQLSHQKRQDHGS